MQTVYAIIPLFIVNTLVVIYTHFGEKVFLLSHLSLKYLIKYQYHQPSMHFWRLQLQVRRPTCIRPASLSAGQ